MCSGKNNNLTELRTIPKTPTFNSNTDDHNKENINCWAILHFVFVRLKCFQHSLLNDIKMLFANFFFFLLLCIIIQRSDNTIRLRLLSGYMLYTKVTTKNIEEKKKKKMMMKNKRFKRWNRFARFLPLCFWIVSKERKKTVQKNVFWNDPKWFRSREESRLVHCARERVVNCVRSVHCSSFFFVFFTSAVVCP